MATKPAVKPKTTTATKPSGTAKTTTPAKPPVNKPGSKDHYQTSCTKTTGAGW